MQFNRNKGESWASFQARKAEAELIKASAPKTARKKRKTAARYEDCYDPLDQGDNLGESPDY